MAVGIITLIISMAVLIFLVYKRVSPLIVGPLASLVVAVFGGMAGDVSVVEAITKLYMQSAGNYIINFFLVFMTGAIFGKIMHETGAAASIGKGIIDLIGPRFAIAAAVIATGALTYGGISLFVIIFVMYPLSLALFKEANISKKLIPGAVALGAFTFTMTTPGTPQIQNIIPTEYLGTGPMAGAIPGLVGGLFMAVAGIAYMMWMEKRSKARGEGFDAQDELKELESKKDLPNVWISLLPSVVIILALNVFKQHIVVSMTIGILLAMILLWKYLEPAKWMAVVNKGASDSTLVMLNTAAIVGYGGVVAAAAFFPVLKEAIINISVNPYFFPAITTTAFAGLAGSASGGMGLAYEALGSTFASLPIPLEAVHRISAMAAGGLDSLPHCGAVVTLLMVCGLTHADSYKDIFVTTLVIPLITVFVIVIPLSMIFL